MLGCGRTRALFFREDNSILTKDLKLLATVGDSVGLVVIERLEEGRVVSDIATGFLLGGEYLMTARHVFENKINAIFGDAERCMRDDESWKNWIQAHFPGTSDLSLESALNKYVETEQSLSFEDLTQEMSPKGRTCFNDKLKKQWDGCHATFWKSNATDNPVQKMDVFFSQQIPFVDKENDVIILKILLDSHQSLPKGLILHKEYEKRDKLSLYGYIKHEGCEELHLDPQCSIYIDPSLLEKHIEEAKQWWQKKENETNCYTKKMDFNKEFTKCSSSYNEDSGCFTMQASEKFVHGTSGSPLVFITKVGNKRRPVVAGMYLRGFPDFYYILQSSMRTHHPLPSDMEHYNKFRNVLKNEKVPLKHFFQAGVTMKRVAEVLEQSENGNVQSLKKAIFSAQEIPENIDGQSLPSKASASKIQEEESSNVRRKNRLGEIMANFGYYKSLVICLLAIIAIVNVVTNICWFSFGFRVITAPETDDMQGLTKKMLLQIHTTKALVEKMRYTQMILEERIESNRFEIIHISSKIARILREKESLYC